MTPQQLAERLHRSPRTVVAMIRRGDISPENVRTNGASGNGRRYWVDVTREYGKGEGDEPAR